MSEPPKSKLSKGWSAEKVQKAADWLKDKAPAVADTINDTPIESMIRGSARAADDTAGTAKSTWDIATGNGDKEDYTKALSGLATLGLPGIIGFIFGFKITDGSIMKSMLFAGVVTSGVNIVMGMIKNKFNTAASNSLESYTPEQTLTTATQTQLPDKAAVQSNPAVDPAHETTATKTSLRIGQNRPAEGPTFTYE